MPKKIKMTKADSRMEDARRQGQFEGQVLATLGEIKNQVSNINTSQSGLDNRVRVSEGVLGRHDEMFKDSERIHNELQGQIGAVSTSVEGLIKYQSVMRGIIIALGILSTIISPIITAVLLQTVKTLTKN